MYLYLCTMPDKYNGPCGTSTVVVCAKGGWDAHKVVTKVANKGYFGGFGDNHEDWAMRRYAMKRIGVADKSVERGIVSFNETGD